MMTDQQKPGRKKLHTRSIVYEGFLRDDGLWEIEGTILDTKAYPHPSLGRGVMKPGEPVHQMKVRLAVDNDYVVREAECDMSNIPFDYCMSAGVPVSLLVGKTLGRGWRESVNEAMGGTLGCTHVREMLYSIVTPAFQAIGPYKEVLRAGDDMSARYSEGERPFFLNQCHSWAVSSPVVKEKFPKFYENDDER